MSQIEKFKQNTVVLDTETTNMLPELCEVVEVAGSTWQNGVWHADSVLLGAHNGIPPEASAKNNISNRMIAGLPTFDQNLNAVKQALCWDTKQFFVAHNSSYDQSALATAFGRCDLAVDIAQCLDKTRWICTYRLSKHIIDNEFNDMQYNLSYLRYKLDLPVPDNMGVHRATDDTLVCAALLDYLVEQAVAKGLVDPNGNIGVQLVNLSWNHISVKNWPFGKYKGQPLKDVPTDYYLWAFENLSQFKEGQNGYDYDLAESVRAVLEARLTENA